MIPQVRKLDSFDSFTQHLGARSGSSVDEIVLPTARWRSRS